jgi:hypothetical protein
MTVPTNPQSEDTPPSPKMAERTEKRMVAPGTRDAPKFKSSNPEELLRFISRMEDLWEEAGVTDNAVKKKMIGKYADSVSEEEWSSFDSFEEGTWLEFKDELISNYPEVAAARRGTPARIRKICAEQAKIRLGDVLALYEFRKSFLIEARKLLKAPAVMANRELVELFIGCLTESFASAVLQFLGNRPPSSQPKKNKGKASSGTAESANSGTTENVDSENARRPEDKYDLEDVWKAALQVSENSQGMFDLMKKREPSSRSEERDVFVFNQPPSVTKILSDKVEELEGVQAQEKDRLETINKMIESRMGGLENLIKSLLVQHQNHASQGMCKGDCRSANCKMHDSNSNPMQKGGKSLENEKCFWCGLFGHFQADCDDLKNHIRLGSVKINQEGKLRLKDGSFIPKHPVDASLKERVERHYARKPSQYFYGEYEENDPVSTTAPSILSQFMGTSNDDKRIIAQLKAELDLRKREEALELKQKMLEQNEKKREQPSGSTRTTSVLELLEQLTEEELAAIKSVKSGFI